MSEFEQTLLVLLDDTLQQQEENSVNHTQSRIVDLTQVLENRRHHVLFR